MQKNESGARRTANSQESLFEGLPDLVLQMHRDGTVLRHAGGRSLGRSLPTMGTSPPAIDAHWPPATAALIKQLTRRAIAARGTADGGFVHGGQRYEARVSAQSPDTAICLIRPVSDQSGGDIAAEEHEDERLDRRQFWSRLTESMSTASLRERPIAAAVIHVEGLTDISQIMDGNVSDRVIRIAVQRLSLVRGLIDEPLRWYVGQVSNDELALIVESDDRDVIETCAGHVCESLRSPIHYGDAVFSLQAYAGVAILGQDASSQKALLDNARSASVEARRAQTAAVCFFSDTMKLRSLTRLDIAKELRDAIMNRDIRLKYRGRHDLESGCLVALVGYLQWRHPVRGEIRPAHFLSVAAATGLSTSLSRSLLDHLRNDVIDVLPQVAPEVRISYGALRHHVLDKTFVADIAGVLDEGAIGPERLELRISERTYVARESAEWQSFADRGVQLVVDEVGRKMSSIERLARAPLWGIQLDRSCAEGVADDATSAKVCRAVVGVAQALDLVPIATAVDSARQRDRLMALGYTQGIGDCHPLHDHFTQSRKK